MADSSSKGLLPQLTDVLHALTACHELLLDKLQAVRLESTGSGPFAVEERRRAHALTLADQCAPSVVSVKTDAAVAADQTPSIAEPEQSIQSTPNWLGSTEIQSSSGAATASAVGTESASSRTVTEPHVVIFGNDMLPAVSALRPVPIEPPVARSDSPAESTERNYNFFDELDARLTSFTNHESEPEAP